jgi:hypothetical protein
MGKYRHVTDLRAFAHGLTVPEAGPLRLVPAADYQRRRGAAARRMYLQPDLPAECHEDVGAMLLPAPKARGNYIIPWGTILDSVRLARAHGTAGGPLDGHDGVYLALVVEGAEGCEPDAEFRAAIESGDAVWSGGYLYVRVGGRPVETMN